MLQTLKHSWFHGESVNVGDRESAKAYPKLGHLRKTLSIAENDDTDVEDELQALQDVAHWEIIEIMSLSKDARGLQMRNQLP